MFGKSDLYGFWPSTTTWRRCSTSDGVNRRPSSSLMKLTAEKFSVAPRIADLRRLLVAVVDARPVVAPPPPSQTSTTRDRRRLARDRAGVLAGDVRPLRHLEERLARRRSSSALNFCTKTVFGPSARIESRSDSSNPRMSDVIPTIDVMPMTTPRTVSAERILLVRSVSNDIDTISRTVRTRIAAMLIRRLRSASIGSSRAARIAGYSPKNSPTTAVIPMPIATDQNSHGGRQRR